MDIALVGDDTNKVWRRLEIASAIDATDKNRAAIRPGEACAQFDRSYLAGTVGAEKTEKLALAHVEGYLIYSDHLGEPLGQLRYLDEGV